MRKKIVMLFLLLICCFLIACKNDGFRRYKMEDGTKLRMSSYQGYYMSFSLDSDEIIMYPYNLEEMKIAYTIIDNEEAMQYMDEIPFVERGNDDKYSAFIEEGECTYFCYCAPFISEDTTKETEYHYWVYIKYLVENEDAFKRTIEIEDDISRNTISGNLDLYEED